TDAEGNPGRHPNAAWHRPPRIDQLPPVARDDHRQSWEHREGIALESRGTHREEQEDPACPRQQDGEAAPKVRRAEGGGEEEGPREEPKKGSQPEAAHRERDIVERLPGVEKAENVLIHEEEAKEVEVARGEEKVPGNEDD